MTFYRASKYQTSVKNWWMVLSFANRPLQFN